MHFTNMVSVDVKAYAKEHFDKSVENPYHSGVAKYCCAGRELIFQNTAGALM